MPSPLSRLLAALAFAALALFPSAAEAQRCSKGKPCGNTCIARSRTCHLGQGSAVWAPGADTTGSSSDAAVEQEPAPGALPGLAALAGVPPASVARCTVTRIVDGDTVYCAGGRKVRLLLIDAPERGQGPYGARATAALRSLLPFGTQSILEFDVQRQDRYRRDLAYIHLPDGRMVNEEMVRAGYAEVSVYPPNVKHVERMRAARAEAREARRGLWSGSAFECLPAEHRRGRC